MKITQFFACCALLLTGSALFAQTYNFQHQVIMEITMDEKGAENHNLEYVFMFPEEGNYYGAIMNMSGVEAKSVFDMDKKTMTTLMMQGGMKMGMQYDLDKAMGVAENTTSETPDVDINKTGKTKDILGYTCQEYVVKGDDGSYTEMWMTDELEMANVYSGFAALNKKQNTMGDMPKGFLMQLTSWPDGQGTKEKFEMKTKAINLNQASSISADGYSIMKLN